MGTGPTLPLDVLHSGEKPNPYRPSPAFRVKGVVGYGRASKPKLVRFHGEIWDREVRARVFKQAYTMFVQYKRRTKAMVAKQARKINRAPKHRGRVDIARIRGRQRWGA